MADQRPTEQSTFSLLGPFGGIQSECPASRIEGTGFADLENMMLLKGSASVRPGLAMMQALPGATEPIVGTFDFFDSFGTRVGGVWTPTRMFIWAQSTGSWIQVSGTLTGGPGDFFSKSVVAGKLLFSQGVDKVQLFDGEALTFAPASANAVPALYLGELNSHLLALATLEGGAFAPQRIRWTGIGDPTDWLSFPAGGGGQGDLFNDMGPIAGYLKLFQSGYIFQRRGIVQALPTGNGLVPFDFVPVSTNEKGCYFPHSIAGFGEDLGVYAGKDNIYSFDGTESLTIGDHPLSGRSRIGARSRIYADLLLANSSYVFGYLLSATSGRPYKSYWLFVGQSAVWVYNFDETNWTRFALGFPPTVAGEFLLNTQIRISDLAGEIGQQQWTPFQLGFSVSILDSLLVCGSDGSLGLFNFALPCEEAWSLKTGDLNFGDTRHSKNLRAMHLVMRNQAAGSFTVQVTSETGQTESHSVSVLAGTSYQVVPFRISGVFLTTLISGPAGSQISFDEITYTYNIGAEIRTQ